jgi:peptidoglycan/LPS O-acetylase OafA/YrhL
VCSYSLYLLHEPILFAVPQGWVAPYGTLARLLFLGLIGLAVLLLSALSYLAIEAPCVKLGKQLIRILKTQTHRPALE